ncbi:DMT family transporter [Campylobacterota bacterium DY0563]
MQSRSAVAIFLLLGIVWGSNFIYMKWASEFITPLQVVLVRVLFGFIPVLVYALYKKVIKIEHFKYSFHFFMMSLLGTTVYYYFFVKATSLLLSGVTGALSGSIPLFAFLLGIMFLKEEKLDRRIIGIFIGMLGVIFISKPFNTNLFESNLEGIIDIILGSLIVGSSFVYAKRFLSPLKIHFAALTTYQLGFALITLLFITDLNGLTSITNDIHVFLGSVIGLGLLGTGLAFILYYYLIENLGAIAASSATYMPPVVALIIGYFFIGEEIDLIDCLGTVLIFGGVFLVNKKR